MICVYAFYDELRECDSLLNKPTTDFGFAGNFRQIFCCMFPLLSLLFRFFFSVKTNHKSFQQKCAEVRKGVYPVLMPNIVL